MDVLLSKLSYRLYEMESRSLSYETYPLDNLIDIKDDLEWLTAVIDDHSNLIQLKPALTSLMRHVVFLQQRFSPFSSSFRELLLEFIDLTRQFVLGRSFYMANDFSNFASQQVEALSLKIEQELIEFNLPEEKLNAFEAKLEQDNDTWLDSLIDFIERFTRLGEFSVESALDAKFKSVIEGNTLHQNLVPYLLLKVKTAQSLVWIQHHFKGLEWQLTKNEVRGELLDFSSVFMCLRQMQLSLPKRDIKNVRFEEAYEVLRSAYLTIQTDTIENLAKQFTEVFGLPAYVLPHQKENSIPNNIFPHMFDQIREYMNCHDTRKNQRYLLVNRDIAGESFILVYASSIDTEFESTLESSRQSRLVMKEGSLLALKYGLDMLEQKVILTEFDGEMICIPEGNICAIQNWRTKELINTHNGLVVDIEVAGFGRIDIYADRREVLESNVDSTLIVCNYLGKVFGILVGQVLSNEQAYKVASYGLDNRVHMIWQIVDFGLVVEKNFDACREPKEERLKANLTEKKQVELFQGMSAWIVKISNSRFIVTPDIVKKHVSGRNIKVLEAACIDYPMVRVDEGCYPCFADLKKPYSSLLLLEAEEQQICLPVNSIYYEKSIDTLLEEMENVRHIKVDEIPLVTVDKENVPLYVIDANSFQ